MDVFSAAGDAFCRAASVQIKCGSKHEAATQYIDASTCYKKADPAGGTDTHAHALTLLYCNCHFAGETGLNGCLLFSSTCSKPMHPQKRP